MKKQLITALLASSFITTTAFADEVPDGKAIAAQEWRALIEPLLPLGEKMVGMMAEPDDPLLRQEIYRQNFSAMSMAYMGLFLGDAGHPDFWPLIHQAWSFLAPNPDDSYYLAPIDGNGSYRMSGYRGTVRIVDVQVGSGSLMPHGTGTLGPNIATYDLDTVHINKKDGAFSVILSEKRPEGYKGDWWKIEPKASYILIRQIAYDWNRELDGRLAIERLDTPAIKPRLSAAQIQDNLRTVSSWVDNWNTLALKWANGFRAKGYVNKVFVHPLKDIGGVGTQQYIEGEFELAPDEALIYQTEVPAKCRYWNIMLTDMQLAAIDPLNRQTSLNGHTAKRDKDGKFRAVISAGDPGVPNWLDSAGYARGTLSGRWNDCSSNPTPTMIRVKLADVRKALPTDTPAVSAEERDAALRLRRTGAQLRKRW